MNEAAIVTATAELVGLGVYAFLGLRLARRSVSPTSQLANYQFATFWLGLALAAALSAIEDLIAVATVPPLALVVTAGYLEILLLCVILWSLVGYLLFLFTSRQFLVALSLFYAALYVALVYLITASQPTGVTVTNGSVAVTYATSFSLPLVLVLVVGLLVPELVAAVLYFTLVFRTKDRTVRYRITLVSWSLIAIFGLSFVNLGAAVGGGLAGQVLSQSVAVFAAIVILLAYYPPVALQRRLGISAVAA
jgi:hypothetical protein